MININREEFTEILKETDIPTSRYEDCWKEFQAYLFISPLTEISRDTIKFMAITAFQKHHCQRAPTVPV